MKKKQDEEEEEEEEEESIFSTSPIPFFFCCECVIHQGSSLHWGWTIFLILNGSRGNQWPISWGATLLAPPIYAK